MRARAVRGARRVARRTGGERDPAVWHCRLAAALGAHADARAALAAVCDVVRELLPCDRVQVWRGDVRQMTIHTVAASGYDADEARRLESIEAPMPAATLGRSDFLDSKIAFVAAAAADPEPFAAAAFAPFGIAAAALLLLDRGGHVVGALQLSWCTPGAGRAPAPDVADAIRRYASLAVDFVARTDDAVRLAQSLSDVAILLGGIHDPEELLQTATAKMAEAVGCDWCAIHLLDESRTMLVRAGQHGLPEAYASLERLAFDPGYVDRALAALQDGVFEVPDVAGDAGPADPFDRRHVASYFSVPLLEDGVLAGFLTLGRCTRTGRFSRRQLTLAKGLAHHALAALRNARIMRSLREVNQFKTDFIAAVSHDLRTPLHVLIGYSDMLADGAAGELNPEQAELVRRLRDGALHFRDLIEDVLDVARLDSGHDAVAAREVDLDELCAAVRAELEPMRRAGVAVRCDVRDAEVVGDGAKIKTILRNLLSNALKFTRDGEVRIAIARGSGDELLLRVCDTGPGIAVEDRPRIFEMFQQGDAGRRAGGSGLGLGLYLVRRVTELLGGRVWLVSADPGDTCFEVSLPIRFVPRRPDAPP